MKQKAFSLIELLVCITIIGILMALTAGIIGKIKSRIRAVKTGQTFSILTQGLQIYKNITGSYPAIKNLDVQVKLYEALSRQDWEIKNFRGVVVENITNKPCLSVADLIDDKTLKKEGGNYYFYDGWGNRIYYYYGPIDEKDSYASRAYVSDTGTKYNQNWPWNNFDLFSCGADGKTGDSETLKDDITNFK